jgi:hypothetical protein
MPRVSPEPEPAMVDGDSADFRGPIGCRFALKAVDWWTRSSRRQGRTEPVLTDFEFLLFCASERPDPLPGEEIRARIAAGMDWERLIALAARHRLLPLMLRLLLERFSEDIPDDRAETFRRVLLARAARNHVLTDRLFALLDDFDRCSLPAIPLKGPVLATLLEGGTSLRHFDDLDILVASEDFSHARSVLESAGYLERSGLHPGEESWFLGETGRHALYESHDQEVIVELHREVGYAYLSSGFGSDAFLASCKPTMVLARPVLTPSPQDLLIYLCVHGAVHTWNRLSWIRDVARFVRVSDSVDWSATLDYAESLGCKRIVLLGLYLANRFLETPLPEDVLPQGDAPPHVFRLSETVRRALVKDSQRYVEKARRRLFYFRVMDRKEEKRMYAVHLLTSPQPDWSILDLPAGRFFVHFAFRAIRLGVRIISQALVADRARR